ncbi:DUF3576 domain-containing protein [Hirschia baltica]|uniref:DUF3576 domain-containing protein n=1 Tax=Hirschia baltica (strain ATCC 49814 / DSM 5838 / IFAM 1418) TaxID=582402 RepID=C6XKB2_HIRBI|nr:DUF3576 domain-containing protein [Hirschia baltica]ACT57710.1 hypothetical protein Hbal_0008 [Hirschia baltica ATCC 49814]
MASVKITGFAILAASLAATGCSSFGGSSDQATVRKVSADGKQQAGIGVNAYLWRASLDTISFMPLKSADPYGGVINSDWYANPELPDERFKTTVYILDTRLRADGVKVAVQKEVLVNGNWQTANVDEGTGAALENAILSRARELRLSSIE